MFNLKPVVRISIGLVMLTVSMLLIADILGLLDNDLENNRRSNFQFGQTIALQISNSIANEKKSRLETAIKVLKDKKKSLLSIGVRLRSNQLFIDTGNHKKLWGRVDQKYKKHTHFEYPIYNGKKKWGQLELRFEDPKIFEVAGFQFSQFALLILFFMFSGFSLYRLYLKRSLKHLDPNNVVPSRVRNALDALAEGVVLLDVKENILLANQAFLNKTHLEEKELLGKKLSSLSWMRMEDDPPWVRSMRENLKLFTEEVRFKTGHTEKIFTVNCSPIVSDSKSMHGSLITFDDVTELEEKESELQKLKRLQAEVNDRNRELRALATKDSLTGCLNRRAFFEKLEREVEENTAENIPYTIAMLDIDHFKNINDTFGHQLGDMVIKALAKIIRRTIRVNDFVCRYGGEEFCLYLKNVNMKQSQIILKRIKEDFENYNFNGFKELTEANMASSIGVSDHTNNATDITENINQADLALFLAKKSGRNQICFYDESTTEKIKELDENFKGINGSLSEFKDNITGLSARSVFIQTVSELIELYQVSQKVFGLIMIDINMFKRVNESIGHSAGDKLLKEVGDRITKCFRDVDIIGDLNYDVEESNICRLGGDEFGIIVNNIQDQSVMQGIIERCIQTIIEPYRIDDVDISLTCSAGIALYPQSGHSSDSILKHAELAMYHAKKQGKNSYHIYSQDLETRSAEQLQLEYEILNAIDEDQFVLYYQPKYCIKTGQIVGMESLLRWQHPRIDLLPPGKFIPLAEETGSIIQLGHWALEHSCHQLKAWEELGIHDLHMSVNVSPIQFKEPKLIEQIISVIESYGIKSGSLEVEITETAIMDDIEKGVKALKTLQDHGVCIALDDFGVGYSSLNYIKRIPADRLKIDRSFIININDDLNDQSIVKSIVNMGHDLQMQVIAEGVETEEQLEKVQALGADEVQGYYFSKPLEVSAATQLLLENRAQKHTGDDSQAV